MKNIIIFLAFLTCFVFLQLRTWIYKPTIIDESTYILVKKGSGSSVVADTLYSANIIDKPWLFKIAARLFALDKKLKAGEYEFKDQVSIYDIMQKMVKGDVFYHKITLAEGLTSQQMLEVINNEKLLTGDISIEVNEGELLPETYSFTSGDTKDSIIKQAKHAMISTIKNTWDNRQDNLPIKNINQLVTLASIIEKETAIESERGLVASVFINRLIKGMRLQTDPTVIYALTQGKRDLGRLLTRKDLTVDNPYNTYKYYGLPPTPICNPGKASLEAAANPEYSNYLYFVADGNGGHNFSASLKEHNNNVKNWKKKKK